MVYVKNAKNVKAENLEVTVHDNMKEWVDKEICFENAVVKEKWSYGFCVFCALVI